MTDQPRERSDEGAEGASGARLEGTVLGGDFEILHPLSEGGMGSVYVARQISTGQRRAVKVMHPDLVENARLRSRFEAESKIAARIQSDHVVSVLAAGVDDRRGVPFIVMELLEGETLFDRIENRGAMPIDQAQELFAQMIHAVIAAHRSGIVHRDLKPENLLLSNPRRAGSRFVLKVLDFGIAKLLADSKSAKTQAIGTPLWMAPEQSETTAGRIGPATDVWALGLLAFYVLTGKAYWRTANEADAGVHAKMREILFEPIVPASLRARELEFPGSLPEGFDAVFARAVSRKPEDRYPDAEYFYRDLERVLSTLPAVAPPPIRLDDPPPTSTRKRRKRAVGPSNTLEHEPMSRAFTSNVAAEHGADDHAAPARESSDTMSVPSLRRPRTAPVVTEAPALQKPKDSNLAAYAVLGTLVALGFVGLLIGLTTKPEKPKRPVEDDEPAPALSTSAKPSGRPATTRPPRQPSPGQQPRGE